MSHSVRRLTVFLASPFAPEVEPLGAGAHGAFQATRDQHASGSTTTRWSAEFSPLQRAILEDW